MNLNLALLIAAALIALVWLVLTWYCADDQAALGPWKAGRVTFKQVVAGAFADVVEFARPVWLRIWLNAPFAAMLVLDGISLTQDDLRHAIYTSPWGIGAIVLLNAVSRYGSTPAHPPVAAAHA